MAATVDRPLLLFAFANDRVGDHSSYLRNLPAERRRLRAIFPIEVDRPYDVLFESNITPERLRSLLDRHHGRLIGFHFGGHATGGGLSLETDDGRPDVLRVEGFAGELAALPRLAFVFLNGCSTANHVDALRRAGGPAGPAVVATEWAIRDDVATTFAERFYRNLSLGRTLAEAYGKAEDQQRGHLDAPTSARSSALAAQRPDDVGCLEVPHRMARPASRRPTRGRDWPWALFEPPERPEAVQWRLPSTPDVIPSSEGTGRRWVQAPLLLAMILAAALAYLLLRSPTTIDAGDADRATDARVEASLAEGSAAVLDGRVADSSDASRPDAADAVDRGRDAAKPDDTATLHTPKAQPPASSPRVRRARRRTPGPAPTTPTARPDVSPPDLPVKPGGRDRARTLLPDSEK